MADIRYVQHYVNCQVIAVWTCVTIQKTQERDRLSLTPYMKRNRMELQINIHDSVQQVV